MGCKTAIPQGIHVAQNLLAEMAGKMPQPLHFSYILTCVSLGRRDGLVQVLKPSGEPTTTFFPGRTAAWIKEFICRLTVWTLQLEQHFDFYDWVTPRARSEETSQPQRPAHSQGV